MLTFSRQVLGHKVTVKLGASLGGNVEAVEKMGGEPHTILAHSSTSGLFSRRILVALEKMPERKRSKQA